MHASNSVSSEMAGNINWNAVEAYIREHIEDLPPERMTYKAFHEGLSNLTYFIQIGNWEAVMRRPPFGDIPPKAHDMKREHHILNHLSPHFPLAPKPYLYCDDPRVMEKHFYIMEKKNGVVLGGEMPPEYEPTDATGRAISNAVVKTLVRLHEVDYAEAGLADIGRPKGFIERQLHLWMKRYERSKTDVIPGIAAVQQWLLENIPQSVDSSIIHNDFKLNNIMLSPSNPGEAVGVFDWELSTIGDPLADLGTALVFWMEEGEESYGLSFMTHYPGLISRREFLHQYASLSNRNVEQIHYYLAFGFYKIGVILQQLYYRYKQGSVRDERFAALIGGVFHFVDMAMQAKDKKLL